MNVRMNIDLDEVVIADRFNGAAMNLGDGGAPVYLLCIGGYKRTGDKHDNRVPDTSYALTLNDLSTIVARLMKCVTDAGEGRAMMVLLAPKLGMDPIVTATIAQTVDEKLGRSGG